MGSTLGKIQEYATSSGAASGLSVEIGNFTPEKWLKKGRELGEADPPIEQVAPARHAGRVDISDRADHEVEGEAVVTAKLRQHPEYGLADFVVLLGAEIQSVQAPANGSDLALRGTGYRTEVGGGSPHALAPCDTKYSTIAPRAIRRDARS